MRNYYYLHVFIIVVLQLFCHSPEAEKSRPGIKYLQVTADIPDDLLVKVRNYYKSIPTWCGCKSLSEQSWNWVPLEFSDIYLFSGKDKQICVPLFINKSTVCKWINYETQIFITKSDSFEIAGFGICPTANPALTQRYETLVDTIRFLCYKCVNQFMESPDNDVFTKCDQLGRDEENPVRYTYEGIQGDTAHITVIAKHDNSPVRYMDTTLAGPNYFRVFGEDEKIPGL